VNRSPRPRNRKRHIGPSTFSETSRREPINRAAKQLMRGPETKRARHEFGVRRRAKELRQFDHFAYHGSAPTASPAMITGRWRLASKAAAAPIAARSPAQPRRSAWEQEDRHIAAARQNVPGQRQEYRPGLAIATSRLECRRGAEPGVGEAMHLR